MARYGRKAATAVKKAMEKRKKGTLKSGRSGKTVRSRKQAIAIGLSEARRAGGKVPDKKAATPKSTKPKAARKKSAARKATSKKTTTRRGPNRASPGSKKKTARKPEAKKSP